MIMKKDFAIDFRNVELGLEMILKQMEELELGGDETDMANSFRSLISSEKIMNKIFEEFKKNTPKYENPLT